MSTLENKQTSPIYRYIKVRPSAEKQEAELTGASLYIGTSAEVFSTLKETYPAILHAENLEQGGKMLEELERLQGRGTAIFLDLPLNYEEFYVFQSRKDARSGLLEVPVLMNVRNLNREQVSLVRRKKLVDELIDFKIDLNFIGEKIGILHFIRRSIHDRKGRIRVEYKRASVQSDFNPVKRIMNLFFSLSLIVMAFPLLALIALVIKLESRGPVLHNTYNAGRGYHIFKLFHFRTMKVGADRLAGSMIHMNTYNNFGHHPLIIQTGRDPRLTRIGRILAWSGLDKLPALFNVVLGDIALVGDRPLSLIEASSRSYQDGVDCFMHPVGMTGFWKGVSVSAPMEDFMKARNAVPFGGYVTLAMDKNAGYASPMHEGGA
jgi:lipopolysaccharide/colanic/teichoic acid biosynthesis glycosyltransferase